MAAGAVGADQCAAAVGNRKGRWACPTTGRTPAAAPAGYWGWCDSWSCRHRTDDFKSDEQLNATWGCGGTTLGAVQVYASFQLTGPKTLSKPVYYYNTSASQTVVITGDLLNSAAGAVGTEVPGAFSLYNAGDVPGAQQISWNPNGYLSYDNKNWDHSQVHQWSWNDTSSDCSAGYWYVYAKNICTHTQDKLTYRFDAVNQVPANPDGGGWRT